MIIEPQPINIPNAESIIKSLYWDLGSKETIIFVGGDGDTKDLFIQIIEDLIKSEINYNILTFSYTGLEEGVKYPLKQSEIDLQIVLDWVIENLGGSASLVCTSMGAFSTCKVLANNNYKINKALFIDPADYYLKDQDDPNWSGTWNGSEEYAPNSKVASDLLKQMKGECKVSVVNFLLRNYSKNGYSEVEERGIDNPKYFSRLNNKMVKRFWKNTPEANRGEYIENHTIPHAFMRDGDIEKNIVELAKLIQRLIN